MSNKKQQIPDIRFKGFTDDWEQRKLGELINLENGFAFKSEYFQEDPSDVIVLTPGNVNIGGGFQSGKGRFYNIAGKFPDKFIFKPGDIFVTMTDLTPSGQTLGLPAIVPDDGITYLHNQRLGKLVNFSGDREFLFYVFNTEDYHKHIVATASGTTVKHSSSSKILDYVVHIPIIEEQTKIGAFLNKLDNTIAIHQRQLDNYKELKKAMLQKIFNQELRFKNDDGNDYPDWREVILEEICLYKSSNISLDSFKEYNGEEIYPLYDANSLVLNIDKYDQENEYVSIIKDGAGVGRIRYCEGKSSVLGTMGYLLPTDTVDIKFLYFRLQIINFLSYVSGSTIPHIYFKDYKKENIGLPCEDEQKKIADVLSALDIKIEISVQKIEALKQQKKGFMQQMFV